MFIIIWISSLKRWFALKCTLHDSTLFFFKFFISHHGMHPSVQVSLYNSLFRCNLACGPIFNQRYNVFKASNSQETFNIFKSIKINSSDAFMKHCTHILTIGVLIHMHAIFIFVSISRKFSLQHIYEHYTFFRRKENYSIRNAHLIHVILP